VKTCFSPEKSWRVEDWGAFLGCKNATKTEGQEGKGGEKKGLIQVSANTIETVYQVAGMRKRHSKQSSSRWDGVSKKEVFWARNAGGAKVNKSFESS